MKTKEQIQKEAILLPWKVEDCFSGKECWCAVITTDPPIYYDDEQTDRYYILTAAAMDRDIAEYIVNLHNKTLL